jgi:hypothetical protein
MRVSSLMGSFREEVSDSLTGKGRSWLTVLSTVTYEHQRIGADDVTELFSTTDYACKQDFRPGSLC